MTKWYSVYSDVSYRHKFMGYAAWILQGSVTVRRWTGIIGGGNSALAEIEASTRACREIPDRSEVVIYTDIDDAVCLFDGSMVYGGRLAIAIENLKSETARFSKVELLRVSRSAAPYKWCHGNSRIATSHAIGIVRRARKRREDIDFENDVDFTPARLDSAIRSIPPVPYRSVYPLGPILNEAVAALPVPTSREIMASALSRVLIDKSGVSTYYG